MWKPRGTGKEGTVDGEDGRDSLSIERESAQGVGGGAKNLVQGAGKRGAVVGDSGGRGQGGGSVTEGKLLEV